MILILQRICFLLPNSFTVSHVIHLLQISFQFTDFILRFCTIGGITFVVGNNINVKNN